MNKQFDLQRFINLFLVLFCTLFIGLGLQAVAETDDYWLATNIIKGRSFFGQLTWPWTQYFQWSGHIVMNLIQAISTFPPIRTNIVSAIHAVVFVGACLLWALNIYKTYEPERKLRFAFAMTLFMIIFSFSYPVLGEAIFLAASEHAWNFMFLVLGYGVLRLNILEKHRIFRYFIFFTLGNSTEFLIFPLLYLFWRAKKEKTTLHLKRYFLLFLIGAVLNIFSPGVYPHLREGLSLISFNVLNQLYHVELVFLKAATFIDIKLLLLLPLGFVFPVSSLMNLSDLKDKAIESFLLAIFSIIILVPVPVPVENGVFLYFTFFFGLSCFWFIQYLKRRFLHFRLPALIHHGVQFLTVTALLIVLGLNFINASVIRDSFKRQHQIMEFLSGKAKDVAVEFLEKPMQNHILSYSDVTGDKDSPDNQVRAEYYGLETLIAK